MMLALLSVDCLPASRHVAFRASSPSLESDAARGPMASLLQEIWSSSRWGALPMVGRLRHAKTQRRAMSLGSRLEPAAKEMALSPGVKAMRYGKRFQGAEV